MIIGIAGTLGAGKGTVVEFLRDQKRFGHYSSSGLLKEILDERGVPATRENLSKLADELEREHVGGILYLSSERAKADGVTDFILESIHRPAEAEFVRSLGGYILGVDADVKRRYERAQKRQEGEKDKVTFAQFLDDVAREEEGKGEGTPNIRQVIKQADCVLMNDGTLEELHQQIEAFLTRLS